MRDEGCFSRTTNVIVWGEWGEEGVVWNRGYGWDG